MATVRRTQKVTIRPPEGWSHVYIAKRECGCITGFAVDSGDKGCAEDVARFIKSGRTVDRVPLVKGMRMTRCDQHEAEHTAQQKLEV